MSLTLVKSILTAKYNAELTDKLLAAYTEIEQNYFIEKWMPAEVDAGHFAETARRMIEFEQNGGTYTPYGNSLPNFNDATLKAYENGSGDESIRMLIPRILKAVYNIRNKRGAGHVTKIDANEMDATLVLYNVKWVLSEFVRLASNLSTKETQKIVDAVIERHIEVLWKGSDFRRILTKTGTKDQILIHLYDDTPQPSETLRSNIEYSNKSKFNTILKDLHKKKFIEYKTNGECIISPTGRVKAEAIIKKLKAK